MPQHKATIVFKKDKFKILKGKYKPIMKEVEKLRRDADDAYTSDLDIDLTFECEVDV